MAVVYYAAKHMSITVTCTSELNLVHVNINHAPNTKTLLTKHGINAFNAAV